MNWECRSKNWLKSFQIIWLNNEKGERSNKEEITNNKGRNDKLESKKYQIRKEEITNYKEINKERTKKKYERNN